MLLLTLLAYSPGLRAPLSYDDPFLIERSPVVLGARPILDAFRSGYWEGVAPGRGNEYRPLTILSFAVEHRFFGASAGGYRAVNWMLHLACVLLVGVLARQLSLSASASLAAQAVFALHPIHVEAVTGIVGRGELLQTAFALAAVVTFLRPGRVCAVAWPLLGLAGLLAKEAAIVTPVLAALCSGWLRLRDGRRTRSPLQALAFAPVALAYAWARARALGHLAGAATVSDVENPLVLLAAPVRALAGAWVAVRYAWMQLFPVRLSADYGLACLAAPATGTSTAGWASVGLCLAALAAAIAKRRSFASLALGWFALGIAIASNVAMPIGTIFGERLAYLASVGTALGAGAALEGAWRLDPRIARPLGLALVALLAIRTAVRNLDYASEERLFASAVEVCPRSIKARFNWAVDLARLGDLRGALDNLGAALEVRPRWPPALAARGRIRWQTGDRAGAERDFEEAKEGDARNATALAGLGDVAAAAGDCARALELYEAAGRESPGDPYVRAGLERCGTPTFGGPASLSSGHS